MGSYASFNDVHHGTAASPIAETCTACGSTGYVEYPATLLEPELDPCPHGCEPAEELTELLRDEAQNPHQWDALQPKPDVQLDPLREAAFVASLQNEDLLDPFFILETKMRVRGVKRHQPESPTHHGMVSSDLPVLGLLMDGRRVYPAKVPAFLAGKPIHVEPNCTVVEYEYMGSVVHIRFTDWVMRNRMRFAHSWDDSFRTADLLN